MKSNMDHGILDNNGRSITIDSGTPDVNAGGSISLSQDNLNVCRLYTLHPYMAAFGS